MTPGTSTHPAGIIIAFKIRTPSIIGAKTLPIQGPQKQTLPPDTRKAPAGALAEAFAKHDHYV